MAAFVSWYATQTDRGAATQKTSFAPSQPPPPLPPFVLDIANEPYQQLRAGSYLFYSFELNDSRRCHLRGHVQVTDGGSRDVDVFVLDQDGFQNFQNGNSAAAYLNESRTSALTLDLRVESFKKYYLVVSNQFSMFIGKTVSLENVRGICSNDEVI